MFLWFIGLAFVIVASVFASPVIDYRLIIAGSIIPTIEMILDGPWVLHSLAAPVLDRAWTKTSLFWWPVSGTTLKKSELPTWESPTALVLMELVGAMAIIYSIRKYKLTEIENRKLFLLKGHIQRSAMETRK